MGHPVSEETRQKLRAARARQEFSAETKRKLSEGQRRRDPEGRLRAAAKIRGEANKIWKGDEAGYSAFHAFAYRNFPKADACEHCSRSDRKLEWAMLTDRLSRDRSAWAYLCRFCHRAYDKARGYQLGLSR